MFKYLYIKTYRRKNTVWATYSHSGLSRLMIWGDADAEPVQNVAEPVCRGQRGEQSTWGCEESLTVVLAQDKQRDEKSSSQRLHSLTQTCSRLKWSLCCVCKTLWGWAGSLSTPQWSVWNVTMRLAVALNWIAPSESPEIIHGVRRNGKSFQVCRPQRDTESSIKLTLLCGSSG